MRVFTRAETSIVTLNKFSCDTTITQEWIHTLTHTQVTHIYIYIYQHTHTYTNSLTNTKLQWPPLSTTHLKQQTEQHTQT